MAKDGASLRAMGRRASANSVRAWQRMLSGRRLDLLDPSPLDVEIGDIALGLARVSRWNGQTSGEHAFSVAEHSLLVETIVAGLDPSLDTKWRLAALLHDAAEYVIGDLISPFKAALSVDYKSFENRLMAAIRLRFGLPAVLPANIEALIKRADRIAAYYEATGLAGFSAPEAQAFFGRPRGLSPALVTKLTRIKPLPSSEAQTRFLKRFEELHI
jgi:5'-nucleotidase